MDRVPQWQPAEAERDAARAVRSGRKGMEEAGSGAIATLTRLRS